MQIKTQPFKDALEIKNTGIAFDVYGAGSKRIGDLSVTRSGLVWSKGNAQRAKGGVTVKWDDFINWMQSQMQAAPKAKAAAKPRSTGAGTGTANGKKSAIAAKTSPAKSARKKAH
jgi:hypothetical protein